jgi:outer membrane immunogenic protein
LNYRFGDGKKDVVDNSIPPITSSWTGPYLGVGGGYSIAKNQTTLSGASGPIALVSKSDNGNEGGFFSFSAGYDLQIDPKVVIGTFGDADFSNLHYSEGIQVSAGGAAAGETIRSDYKDILMVGGRIGYLTTPDTLLFVSGGYANAGMGDTTINCECVGLGAPADASLRLFGAKRFSGAFIGTGVETKIWDSLSIKAEYRFVDLSSENMTLLPDTDPGINAFIKTKIDPDIQMGRVSINWRFNGNPPPPEVTTGPLN